MTTSKAYAASAYSRTVRLLDHERFANAFHYRLRAGNRVAELFSGNEMTSIQCAASEHSDCSGGMMLKRDWVEIGTSSTVDHSSAILDGRYQ